MYWCGFNGFNQLNNKSNTNIDFHVFENQLNHEEVQQVDFSWSTASVLTSIELNYIFVSILNEIIAFIQGSGQIIISGLLNKRIASFEVLKELGYGPFKSVSRILFFFYLSGFN